MGHAQVGTSFNSPDGIPGLWRHNVPHHGHHLSIPLMGFNTWRFVRDLIVGELSIPLMGFVVSAWPPSPSIEVPFNSPDGILTSACPSSATRPALSIPLMGFFTRGCSVRLMVLTFNSPDGIHGQAPCRGEEARPAFNSPDGIRERGPHVLGRGRVRFQFP